MSEKLGANGKLDKNGLGWLVGPEKNRVDSQLTVPFSAAV